MDPEIFARAFVTLLVILDPLGGVPVFLALTRTQSPSQRARSAYLAVAVATVVVLAFALFGQLILELLGISVQSLMVAGGALLFIVALEMLRGGDTMTATHEDANVALVPLGTPLLAGPGTIAATMVLMRRAAELPDQLTVLAGLLAALGVVLATLRTAAWLGRLLSPGAIHFLTRIMGLLLTGIAVQLVVEAVALWQRRGLP